MRIIADLHIHSKYSRATSSNNDLITLSLFSRIKGIDLLGTGDFTHPGWLSEIRANLIERADGIYGLKNGKGANYLLSTEVATVYEDMGRIRRIHHVILAPDLDTVEQVNDALSNYGSLDSDGRPVLEIDSAELVEIVTSIDPYIEIFPAHAWTPWWSVLGQFGGYDSLSDCYKDSIKRIHALETGLSSDPPMNWRVSWLDRFTLLSNSDSHSPYPYRLGRECTVFELRRLEYRELIGAIRSGDPRRIPFTIEVMPEYGKYHWTGHRSCGISLSPIDAERLENRCPRCGRSLTIGVAQRVERLADRPDGYRPDSKPGYIYLIPLQEIIASVIGSGPNTKRVNEIYMKAVRELGSELSIILDAPIERIRRVLGKEVASVIDAIRSNTLRIEPGYDGLYGRVIMPWEAGGESRLDDFL